MNRISDFTRREIINASKQGYNGKEISKKFGVSSATVYRILNQGGSKEIITEYIPDYRRIIKPKKYSCKMVYGGIEFEVNYVEGILQILNIPGIEDECWIYDKDNIEELKNLGEALVGIASSFEHIMKED